MSGHRTILANTERAFGMPVDSFFYLVADDMGNSKKGLPIEDDTRALMEAIARFRPVAVRYEAAMCGAPTVSPRCNLATQIPNNVSSFPGISIFFCFFQSR